LPYGAPGVERQPEGVPRTPSEALAEAQRLFDLGLPFHAHEVLEDAWKAAEAVEHGLWRGLAQLAVGVTHAARGNVSGAATLLRRGAVHIEPYLCQAPHGIDIAGLSSWARSLADGLESAHDVTDLHYGSHSDDGGDSKNGGNSNNGSGSKSDGDALQFAPCLRLSK
jgi:hypothetical protein